MTQSIHKTTDQYIADLLETKEIHEYTLAATEFRNDPTAKKTLEDFNEAQQTLMIFRQGGFSGVEEQQQKDNHLRKKLNDNKKIQRLISTQQSAQELVADLSAQISKGITIPFVPAQRGGCCG